jgi:hypothetical protein
MFDFLLALVVARLFVGAWWNTLALLRGCCSSFILIHSFSLPSLCVALPPEDNCDC